jgi:phosphate/phosphite/phosphonate ABC transporter binding protein
MADLFSDLLGIPVALVVGDSYGDLVDRFVQGEADLALLPPLSFLAAQDRQPAIQPLASKVAYGTPSYSAFFVVRADDPIQDLAHLKGRRLGFVHRQSTSGYLFPYAALLDVGLDPRTDFSEVVFLGSHPKAIAALVTGRVDVVCTSSGVQNSMEHALEQDLIAAPLRLRVLAKAGRIPYDVMAASPGFPASGVARIRDVLLSLNTLSPMGRDIWRITGKITGWMPYVDARYDDVRRTQERVLTHQEQVRGVGDGE